MPFRPLSYLKFLLKSTNQHGVHSPFVYKYVTQCLYSKKKYDDLRTVDVLLKSVDYFNASSIHLENNHDVSEKIKKMFRRLDFDSHVKDILFFNQLDQEQFYSYLHEGRLHNDSLILIASVHENPKTEKDWEQLIGLPEITVSIDLYYCGLVFIRKEQVKQHFFIRI